MESKPNLWQSLARERNIKSLSRAQNIFNSFSITEKVIFLISALIFALAVFSLINKTSSNYMVEIPAYGGTLSEGVLGTPRFINPILAISDADRDLTALVYSGLLKATPMNDFEVDLAESYSVSDDGLDYTFIIRQDAEFHDGTPVTADDIVFTVTKAQDSNLKSPRRINWEGVVVEKINEREIIFRLKQPYTPFISSLTMGILPKHIWKDLDVDQFSFSSVNIDPIGSGPYEIKSIKRDRNGIPTEFYLHANSNYALGEPFITNISFKFFQNEDDLLSALKHGSVESASNLSPLTAKDAPIKNIIMSAPFTRVFGVFFNQDEKDILSHKEVRRALALAIDKENIIESVLWGFGTVAEGPIPPILKDKTLSQTTIGSTSAQTSIEEAQDILLTAGWKKNPDTGVFELKTKTGSSTLAFSLSTANVPELIESARIIEEAWKKLGASVDVRIFEPSDLNQSVIRPRKYDSLLFGIVTGRNPDFYPFWHSSQRNDPGLNIALYTNAKVDKFLETIRVTSNPIDLADLYAKFESEIEKDAPAIFIWSPDFIYVVPKNLYGVNLGEITTPGDRFIDIENWYMKTDKVWRIFQNL